MKTSMFKSSDRPHALRRNAPAADAGLTPFVAASPDELRYAQRLRERLRERYPNRPSPSVSYWSVGAD